MRALGPTPLERPTRLDHNLVMEAHEIPELDAQPRDAEGHGYVDIFASEKLSVGLAIWPAGSVDRQRPHLEDEVYYVISGRGTILVDGEDRPVKPGSMVFVARGIAHRFHDIEEDLRVLVFWAPPHQAVRPPG
jgi:mannose-6-phosphate isomerase-like protein (cupin superfamily)